MRDDNFPGRTHDSQLTHPNKDTAEAVAFRWIDTKEVRPPDSRAYALLNDQDQKVPQGVVEALRNYDVTAHPLECPRITQAGIGGLIMAALPDYRHRLSREED